jgi:hypothetical protein
MRAAACILMLTPKLSVRLYRGNSSAYFADADVAAAGGDKFVTLVEECSSELFRAAEVDALAASKSCSQW